MWKMLIDKTKSIGQLQNLVMGGRGGGGAIVLKKTGNSKSQKEIETLWVGRCVCVCVCVENFYVEKTP